ncbi:hypothetical protein BpHYR1_020217 [Brachionus plicatilis]|uniref:Uncharacterized protein n=1 Tax=Brachionus plicatilis TaxID=10195 RepID=A0A3M7RI20_BRAPC|nr:hypothetical protein BpHYR1_020217 [Brachionus plicatilis]
MFMKHIYMCRKSCYSISKFIKILKIKKYQFIIFALYIFRNLFRALRKLRYCCRNISKFSSLDEYLPNWVYFESMSESLELSNGITESFNTLLRHPNFHLDQQKRFFYFSFASSLDGGAV